MKRTLIYLLPLFLLVTVPLHAGRYAGDFLAIGGGVRALGMGGAFASLADDGTAIYWNSAGIGQIQDSEVSMMHAYLYNGLAAYDNMNFCQPLPNGVTIGINWTRLTVSDVPRFDEKHLRGTNVDQRSSDPDLQLTGIPDAYTNSTDDMYQFAFSKHIPYKANMGWEFFEVPFDFYFGGNIKFIRRHLFGHGGNGTGIDFSFLTKTDMAVLFDVDWMGKINWGLNFQDISGTDITWDVASNHKDEILYNTKWGFSLEQPVSRYKSVVKLAMDTDYVYKTVQHYGAEFEYNDRAAIRAGVYEDNFTAGASVKAYGVNVDYAFITNTLGNTNRIGLRLNF